MSEGDLSMYDSVDALRQSVERDLVDQLVESLKAMPAGKRQAELENIITKLRDLSPLAHA